MRETNDIIAVDKMKDVKITVLKKTEHRDLIEKYENPIDNACCMQVGQEFFSHDGKMPEDFCVSAWESMAYFAKELSSGGGNFFDGWMKNEKSAMISCNDRFRPVSFLLEVVE